MVLIKDVRLDLMTHIKEALEVFDEARLQRIIAHNGQVWIQQIRLQAAPINLGRTIRRFHVLLTGPKLLQKLENVHLVLA